MTNFETAVTVMASMTVVVLAIAGLARSLLKLRDTFKEMIRVTQENTNTINKVMASQMSTTEKIVGILERKIR